MGQILEHELDGLQAELAALRTEREQWERLMNAGDVDGLRSFALLSDDCGRVE